MLSKTIGYSPIEDALRYLIIPAGITVLFTASYQIRCLFSQGKKEPVKQACRYIGLAILGLVACLQELEQLGKPMLWWRLPLITVGLVFAFFGTIGEGRGGKQ